MDAIHSKSICRTCLYESSDLTSLFDPKELDEDVLTIAEMVYSCTDLEVYSNDQLPQFICQACIETVLKCYVFRKKCHDSDIILRSTEIIDEVKSFEIENEANDRKSPSILKPDDEFNETNEFSTASFLVVQPVVLESTAENKCDDERIASEFDDASGDVKQEYDKDDNESSLIKETRAKDAVKDRIRVRKNIVGRKKLTASTISCDKCNTKFTSAERCEKHQLLNHRNFLCNICGKKFTVKNSFHSHMRIHSNRHICEICSKSFSDIFQLKMHMYVHTGERPYQCLYCPSAFTQNAYLRIHMRTHTKEKPYKCPSCDIAFISKRKLRLHEVEHNPEKYKCSICNKCFRTGESLKRHELAHTGERRFRCDKCNLGFNTRKDLARHFVNHDADKAVVVEYNSN